MSIFNTISAVSALPGPSLGEFGDKFIITDYRANPKKAVSDLVLLERWNPKKYNGAAQTEAAHTVKAVSRAASASADTKQQNEILRAINKIRADYNLDVASFEEVKPLIDYFALKGISQPPTEKQTKLIILFLSNRAYLEKNDPLLYSQIIADLEAGRYPKEIDDLNGLGKPTIKLEFETNNDLIDFQKELKNKAKKSAETEWEEIPSYREKPTAKPARVNGLGRASANALLYNNNEIIDTQGFEPTYTILPSYDHFFKPAENETTFEGFGLDDTKTLIAEYCRKYYRDCQLLANHLKAKTLIQSCFNLWHWLRYNIRYEFDRAGREEIRSPRRVWADRFRGVDCDCLSVFAWCVLRCMGYRPAFELAAFRNKDTFSHIYINCDGVIVDRVWFVFNQRPPQVTKTELFFVKEPNNLGKLF